jgi:hypothetical protein
MAGLTLKALAAKRRKEAARKAGRCNYCFKRPAGDYIRCEDCRQKLTQWHKGERERRRRSGFCLNCNRRPRPGKVICREHILSAQVWRNARRKVWRTSGRCTNCGRARDRNGVRCARCHNRLRIATRLWEKRVRLSLLARYGNACRCCNERRFQFMNLDHVRNDGHIERGRVRNSYKLFHRLVKRRRVDKRYQLLCWNCNLAKHQYGVCPHQAERSRRALNAVQASILRIRGDRQSLVVLRDRIAAIEAMASRRSP